MDDNDEDRRAEQRRLQDLKDLQNENAGRDTGRVLRFTSPQNTPQALVAKKQNDWWFFTAMLSYSEKVRFLNDYLAELDRASYEALQHAERRARETDEDLHDTRSRASTDSQGRRVYRTADGQRAFDENHRELTADEIARVQWRDGSPTWEDYQRRKRAAEEAAAEQDAIARFRHQLHTRRKELNDNPPKPEDIDRIVREFDGMPPSVRAKLHKTSSSWEQYLLTKHELNEAFDGREAGRTRESVSGSSRHTQSAVQTDLEGIARDIEAMPVSVKERLAPSRQSAAREYLRDQPDSGLADGFNITTQPVQAASLEPPPELASEVGNPTEPPPPRSRR